MCRNSSYQYNTKRIKKQLHALYFVNNLKSLLNSYQNIKSSSNDFQIEASSLCFGVLQQVDYQYVFIVQDSTTFTGKELDSETGYSYFGARYYDAELSGLFFSVDPMADKNPSLSPYAYCTWNPMKLVDPDGKETDGYEGNNGQYKWFDKRTEQSFVDGNGVKWYKVTDNQDAWNEAITIREANILGLVCLGFDRTDAERDVRLYKGSNPLFTKESHLLNPQKYIVKWRDSFNSEKTDGITKQSPEIRNTGFSLKYYSNKGGQEEVCSLGIVKSNLIEHFIEYFREKREMMRYPHTSVNDPEYDMHYSNAIGLIHKLAFPKEQLYSPPTTYSVYHTCGGMKLP